MVHAWQQRLDTPCGCLSQNLIETLANGDPGRFVYFAAADDVTEQRWPFIIVQRRRHLPRHALPRQNGRTLS